MSYELQNAIQSYLEKIPQQKIQKGFEELSKKYRDFSENINSVSQFKLESKEQVAAYITTRMPATYTAICAVLQKLSLIKPDLEIDSILDCGAGPGTSIWAFKNSSFSCHKFYLCENNALLMRGGQELLEYSSHQSKIIWLEQDFVSLPKENIPNNQCDIVLASYSIGELSEEDLIRFLDNSVHLANKGLILLEPGTPRGFRNIRLAREILISKGLHIVAPCTHQKACPIKEGDWCHFSERLSRSSVHRKVKDGELAYEDEKFSYLVALKNFHTTENSATSARILRHPLKKSGHIHFELCTSEGEQMHYISSKKQKEHFREMKKAEWGDVIELP